MSASNSQRQDATSTIRLPSLRIKRKRKKSKVPAPLAALEDFNLSDVSDSEAATLSETEELDLKIKNTLSRSDVSTYNLPQHVDDADPYCEVDEEEDEEEEEGSDSDSITGDIDVHTGTNDAQNSEFQENQSEETFVPDENEPERDASTPRATSPQESINTTSEQNEELEIIQTQSPLQHNEIPTITIDQYDEMETSNMDDTVEQNGEDPVEIECETSSNPTEDPPVVPDDQCDNLNENIQSENNGDLTPTEETSYSPSTESPIVTYNGSSSNVEEPQQQEDEEDDTSSWPYAHIGRNKPTSPVETSAPPPRRPPPPQKVAPPMRPPPPTSLAKPIKSAQPIPIAPPPENQRKLRETSRQRNEVDETPAKSTTFFPFRSHFEKKPLVPNPKKAFHNLIHKEDKTTRRMKKEKDQMDKLLNTVDPDEVPSETVSENFKAFQELQARILGTVSGVSKAVSEKESKQNEIEKLLKQSTKSSSKGNEMIPTSDPSWSRFETDNCPDMLLHDEPIIAQIDNKVEDLLGLETSQGEEATQSFDPFGVDNQENLDVLNEDIFPTDFSFSNEPHVVEKNSAREQLMTFDAPAAANVEEDLLGIFSVSESAHSPSPVVAQPLRDEMPNMLEDVIFTNDELHKPPSDNQYEQDFTSLDSRTPNHTTMNDVDDLMDFFGSSKPENKLDEHSVLSNVVQNEPDDFLFSAEFETPKTEETPRKEENDDSLDWFEHEVETSAVNTKPLETFSDPVVLELFNDKLPESNSIEKFNQEIIIPDENKIFEDVETSDEIFTKQPRTLSTAIVEINLEEFVENDVEVCFNTDEQVFQSESELENDLQTDNLTSKEQKVTEPAFMADSDWENAFEMKESGMDFTETLENPTFDTAFEPLKNADDIGLLNGAGDGSVAKQEFVEAFKNTEDDLFRGTAVASFGKPAFDEGFQITEDTDGNGLFSATTATSDKKDATQSAAFGEENETLGEEFEMPNPFRYDRFTEAKAKAADVELLSKKKSSNESGISIIPRARPKPAGLVDTLSGNNPFRKGSIHDDIILSTLEPVLQLLEEEQPTLSVLHAVGIDELETGLVPEVINENGGFDPLQTIYPDSEHSGDEAEPALNILIKPSNQNILDGPKGSTHVPLLPAPPRLEEKRTQYVSLEAEDEEEDTFSGNVPVSEDATAGWNDATVTAATAGDDVAFDVNWSEVQTQPAQEVEVFEPFDDYVPGMVWKLWTRMPEKKKKSKQFSRHLSDRYWKEICVLLTEEKEQPVLQVYDWEEEENPEDMKKTQPLRTIHLQPVMQLSRDKLQQYDKYGKLHIFKVNNISYKEVVGMRTEKFTLKTLQNMVGHKPKSNMVLDHIPIRTEIIKLGCMDKRYLRSLMHAIEDVFMGIPSYTDKNLTYTKEELCCYVQDEYEAQLDATCNILKQKARTRIYFIGFVMGSPYVILGINDIWRFGKEIVRRQDIIPIMHDEWIHIHEPQFHSCINMVEYEKDHMIKFHPLDGCKFELMRFRVSLRENRELPLICTCTFVIDKLKVVIRCDLLAPGFFSASKRHGSTHCNDIEIRIPIPEEWIYHFRVEGRTKYNSMHSTLRKPGKIKGFERIANIAQSFLPPSLLEASSGVAKYEHLYKSLVWRIPQLPEKREGAFKPHLLTCKLTLSAHDPVPDWDNLKTQMMVEYSMNNSTVSGATVRSISVEQHDSVPEKFVKYLAKYEYSVKIKYELGERKTPALKSILDQESPPDEEDSSDHEENAMEQSDGTNIPGGASDGAISKDLLDMDLLDVDKPTTLLPSTSPQPPMNSHLNDLEDLF